MDRRKRIRAVASGIGRLRAAGKAKWVPWVAAALSAAAAPAAPAFQESGKVITVGIEQLAFGPGTVRVPVGTTIRWVNREPVPHTVVSGAPQGTGRTSEEEPGDLFQSATLGQGDAFEFTVRRKRAIPYYCGIHPFMTGVILVE